MAVKTDEVDIRKKQAQELTTEGMPRCVAKYSLGFTINLGNYESAKIESGIEIEGTIDNLSKLQEMAQEEVEKNVQLQINDIKTLKSPNQTLLGAFKN